MKRIEIMRADPVVTNGNCSVRITGRSIELLRLLVLNPGATVGNDAISALHDTHADTAKSKVRYLRNHLKRVGCESLVESDRSIGYRASLSDWGVDALEFQSLVAQLNSSFEHLKLHPIDREAARTEIASLTAALNGWRDNPGLGLSGEHQKHYAHYDGLKRKAADRLLMARLYSQEQSEIREAIQDLLSRARSGADDTVWELLLLAHNAIGSSIRTVSDDIAAHYRGAPPQSLTYLMIAINNGTLRRNPFRNTESPDEHRIGSGLNKSESQDDFRALRDLCSTLGITTASHLRLADSRLTPLACFRRTRKRLYFSGVLASKWVTEPAVRSQFSDLLSRLDQEGGDVRFLVINPKGDGFRRLVELRDGAISTESLTPLKQLASLHKSLSVRLYDSLPAFRIVAIDDDVLSFSPYRLGAEAYLATDRGWEAPHIVLDPLADYPLAEAFRLLFMETWHKAVPMEILE